MTSQVPRCQYVGEADPTKKLGTNAVRNHIDHFRSVLRWIAVHTERSLAKGSDAGPYRGPIDVHRARPALGQAAAKVGAGEVEIVAKDVKQGRVEIVELDGAGAAVDAKLEGCHAPETAMGAPRSQGPRPLPCCSC